jgi:DNA-directed RNA polymerase specialized sigma24 family protein
MGLSRFLQHLQRAWQRHCSLQDPNQPWTLEQFLQRVDAPDLYLASACLDGDAAGWRELFSARTNRPDALLIDTLRSRAARLYPRDRQRQEQAVEEFWGYLLAGEREDATAVLARYDGLRPLVPWLIRVFQNRHLSELRQSNTHRIWTGGDGVAELDFPAPPSTPGWHWHEAFCAAVREWLNDCTSEDLLLLGLRGRYRLSQREVAGLLGIHEGNVSRRTDRLREAFFHQIREQMQGQGWTGDDLDGLILTEMESLLLEEPRLAADRLAALLVQRGRSVPPQLRESSGERPV